MGSFQKQVLKTLKKQEVELIKSDGSQQFNEAIQEAVDTQLVSSPNDREAVIQVVRKGFKYREKVLRPERVIVGRHEG